MSTNDTVRVRIERKQRNDAWEEFRIPFEDHTTIVDLLEWIRSRLDETLLYRRSCHHGSCGTCGMLVNGEHRLACTANVAALFENDEHPPTIELQPLTTMNHIGDLAVDPTRMFRGFPRAASYLRPSEVHKDAQTPEEIAGYERFENCIECGLCVSACPVIPLRGFMGPAVLAAYNREIDKRPERCDELLPQVDSMEGAWGCDRHLACSAVCPTGVYPARHIATLQRKLKKSGRTDERRVSS